ncbi:MAG: hypothetical protein ACJA0C_000520 [Candidatus Endobugula sp.]|jgi:uncharacterized protein (TIGR03503 family)
MARFARFFILDVLGSLYMSSAIDNIGFYPVKVACLALLLLCAAIPQSYAQAPESAKPSDVRLVIDISGSMKKNDPQSLRRPALDMLVQLLPKGSKAGIWTFGQYVNMLVPHKPVDAKWERAATAASTEIKSIAQFTNIGAALEKAAYDHKRQTNKDQAYQTHVILLTDGMVDVDRDSRLNKKERQRILDKVLPMYQQAGITLHTIALSDNADKKLLNKLALATDGKVAVAKNAEELMSVFLQVFNQAVPLEELTFDGNKFAVDSSIEEFTALIFRKKNAKPTTVASPDGQQYTQDTNDKRVKWHHTDQYDLITITEPLEGEWGVSADLEPQSRVTVVSDLSIAVKSMPTNMSVDEVISTSLVLREENKTITRPEFLGLLDISVEVSSPTGSNWTQQLSTNTVPVDGVYSSILNQFTQSGEYTINFTVEGKTFNRQYSHQLSVRTPFSVETDKAINNGRTEFTVDIIAQSQEIDVTKTNVFGVVTAPSGKTSAADFTLQQDGTWRLLIPAIEDGEYAVNVRVDSINKRNEKEKIKLPIVRLSEQNDAIFQKEIPKKEPVKPVELETIAPVKEENITEEAPIEESPKEEADYSQYILYGIIGFINLLIIAIGYVVYRKLFKSKPEENEDDDDSDAEDAFVEPPMDEMAVDDLVEDELEEAETLSAAEEKPVVDDSDSEMEDAMNSALDDSEEEIPDFALDDFSPDSLDEEELDLDESEEDKK